MGYSEKNWLREPPLQPAQRKRRSISVLPTLLTLGNLLCGFAALVYTSADVPAGALGVLPFNFSLAAYLIFAAMVCDMLDGSLARLARSTSDFGAELDSLADVVSFGIVPAFLSLKVIFYLLSAGDTGMPAIVGPMAENLEGRFCWVAAAIYVACTALRLARFNTSNTHDPDSHMIFLGLPSPGAAGVLAASVIFFGAIQAGSPHVLPFNVPPGVVMFCKSVFPYALPLITLLLSALMVSRISYDHVINQYLRRYRPFAHVVRLVVFLLLALWLVLWQPQLMVLVVIYLYAFFPPVRALWRKLWHKEPMEEPEIEQLDDSP
ncbi:MAG TPA: CDP-alcohol phosphatidyltransferase family protein [Phycisphaerae bacterium]|nr:CDP-alcohol phosphatidyltransferase family protein [Phycisphaerae bacterium]